MKRAYVHNAHPGWLVPLDDPRDEEILGAAFDVFAEKGFHGATMLEIATRARASKKTIYERFPDKAALFRALIAWGCRRNVPDAIPPDNGKPAQALERHGAQILTAMMRPESLALFRIVSAEAGRFPEIAKLFDEMVRSSSVAILNVLAARLVKAKLAVVPDGEQFGDDFVSLLRGDVYFRVLTGAVRPLSAARIAAQARAAAHRTIKAYAK